MAAIPDFECHSIIPVIDISGFRFLSVSLFISQTRSRLQAADREGRDCGAKQSRQKLVQRDSQMVGGKDRAPGH